MKKGKKEDRPEWIIYENVKGMLSSNRGCDYLEILYSLDELGYDVEWQNINSKWFVPQNRERIYTIGHLRGRGGRKIFPIEGASGENLLKQLVQGPQSRRVYNSDGISCTITGEGGGRGARTGLYVFGIDKSKNNPKIIDTANCITAREDSGVSNRKSEGTAIVIPTPRAGINIKEATKVGYKTAYPGDSVNLAVPNSKTRRGRVGSKSAQTLDTSCNQGVVLENDNETNKPIACIGSTQKNAAVTDGSYSTTLTSAMGEGGGHVPMIDIEHHFRIRKLTPKECFRLQGWEDEYFERAEQFNSNSQLYKQAGNGVTVSVVKSIGEKIRNEEKENV